MPKKRDKSELEYYRGKCRELEKRIRQLEKQLTSYEKNKHIYNDVIHDYEEIIAQQVEVEELTTKKKQKCPECFKGDLDEFEIMNKVFGTCNSCSFRKRLK